MRASLAIGLAALSGGALGVAYPPSFCAKYTSADDAPYSATCQSLSTSFICPNYQNRTNGIVLLVHGIGVSAADSWSNGPYAKYLPGEGFDVCEMAFPDRALGDLQVAAEDVAFAITYLATRSATGYVSVISHSQGGLVTQWALKYWPSIQSKINSFVSLAGDFQGVVVQSLGLQCAKTGCYPAVWQNSFFSNFTQALRANGSEALVPTTSIYSKADDLLKSIPATSILDGAANIVLQDEAVCNATYNVGHINFLFNSAAFALALDAITHNGTASTARFNTTACSKYLQNPKATVPVVTNSMVKSYIGAIWNVITGLTGVKLVKIEPALKAYAA